MRKTTTFTQIRRIMKLHCDGLKVDEISKTLFIEAEAVQHVIDVRFPKTPKKAEAEAKTKTAA